MEEKNYFFLIIYSLYLSILINLAVKFNISTYLLCQVYVIKLIV